MPQPSRPLSAADRRAGRIEAIVGLVSAALVLAIVGVLVFDAMRSDDGLPELTVEEDARSPEVPGQLRFVVVNLGQRAAASVTVALSLGDPGETDTRRVLVDFVPSHSQASGAFLLGERDRGRAAALSVESYLDP